MRSPETADKIARLKAMNATKRPWAERYRSIAAEFPSIEAIDWDKTFRADPPILGRIVNDIIKLDAAQPGKPGKRPQLAEEDTAASLQRLSNEGYSTLDFTQAFKALVGVRSVRAVAAKTGLNRSMVHRFLQGAQPSLDHMEAIAKAFKKTPFFFKEYREAYLLGLLADRISAYPETSIILIERYKELAKDA